MINDDSLALDSSTSDRTPQCASAPYSDLRGRIWAEAILDYLASEQAEVLINWGVEGKQYVIENGKRVVPADVQKCIIEDNEAFKKESGVFLVWMT